MYIIRDYSILSTAKHMKIAAEGTRILFRSSALHSEGTDTPIVTKFVIREIKKNYPALNRAVKTKHPLRAMYFFSVRCAVFRDNYMRIN
jgi:hypothetical protein